MSIYSVKIASFVQHFGKVNSLHCSRSIWMHQTKWPSSLQDEPYEDAVALVHSHLETWSSSYPPILGCKAEVRLLLLCNLRARESLFEYKPYLFNLIYWRTLYMVTDWHFADGRGWWEHHMVTDVLHVTSLLTMLAHFLQGDGHLASALLEKVNYGSFCFLPSPPCCCQHCQCGLEDTKQISPSPLQPNANIWVILQRSHFFLVSFLIFIQVTSTTHPRHFTNHHLIHFEYTLVLLSKTRAL